MNPEIKFPRLFNGIPKCSKCINQNYASTYAGSKGHVVFCNLFNEKVSSVGLICADDFILVGCSYFEARSENLKRTKLGSKYSVDKKQSEADSK